MEAMLVAKAMTIGVEGAAVCFAARKGQIWTHLLKLRKIQSCSGDGIGRKILASEHLKPGRFDFFDADPFVRVAPGPPMDRVIDALPGLEAFGREATLQVDLCLLSYYIKTYAGIYSTVHGCICKGISYR